MSRIVGSNGQPIGAAPQIAVPGQPPPPSLNPCVTPYGPALIRVQEGRPNETHVFTPEVAKAIGTGLIEATAVWLFLQEQQRAMVQQNGAAPAGPTMAAEGEAPGGEGTA